MMTLEKAKKEILTNGSLRLKKTERNEEEDLDILIELYIRKEIKNKKVKYYVYYEEMDNLYSRKQHWYPYGTTLKNVEKMLKRYLKNF
ncbi:Uncharacterised protein [Fusobacterium necrogenes]|uniref:Uncharacterized protein n=1 Tax=Fusobacterium necrogenes TaxID=858 RepID=A0A377GP57_9FUSO|nr:hypothetical protein [Fusobacterium necrogenes]STO28755.1 Uncharacterised protein [Fusobacterium necrogenes]